MHFGQASVQFYYVGMPGSRVQSVDVLRHGTDEPAGAIQACERTVARVRFGTGKMRPPDHTTRPISAPRLIGSQEVAQFDRRSTLPRTVLTAVVANPRRRAQTGAGQYQKIGMRFDELDESDVHASR